jgi:DNA mismatch repair ATPase MutL
VLQDNPEQREAAFNKALLEKLLEQQNQQEQTEQEQQDQQQQQQSQESQTSGSDQQQEQGEQEDEQQKSEQKPEESEQPLTTKTLRNLRQKKTPRNGMKSRKHWNSGCVVYRTIPVACCVANSSTKPNSDCGKVITAIEKMIRFGNANARQNTILRNPVCRLADFCCLPAATGMRAGRTESRTVSPNNRRVGLGTAGSA